MEDRAGLETGRFKSCGWEVTVEAIELFRRKERVEDGREERKGLKLVKGPSVSPLSHLLLSTFS